LNVISEQEAGHLAEYVRQGGHLVLGPRTGMKDQYNALWPQRQPGPLESLLGARVEQFYALDQPVTVSGNTSDDRHATIWAETLEVLSPETHVWMTYDNGQGWLSDKPAAVTRKVGKGSITYIGAWLSHGLMQTVAARLLEEAGVASLLAGLTPNSQVEICERAAAGKRVWIIINHGAAAETVPLPAPMKDLILGSSSAATGNSLQVAPHDVVVFATHH
jgi:beta-galactosidase